MRITRLTIQPTLAALALALALAAACLAQSDGDGIPDDWKVNGVTVTWPDSHTKHIDLAGLGVQRGRKAVIVWVDWMEGAGHTHRPTASGDKYPVPFAAPPSAHAMETAPLQRVVRSFLGSGVDDNKGVTLALIWADQITWPDQPIPEQAQLGATYIGADNQIHYDWTAFDNIRKQRTGDYGSLFGKGFHYCAFIHSMTGLSNTGLSKGIPGDEFLVSLGVLDDQVGSAEDQSGTFMHELGHNLGLNHGGEDDIGYKPNYLSVMNYMFQRVGIANLSAYGHFDYSRNAVAPIDESKLSQRDGISSVAGLTSYGTAHVCGTPPTTLPACQDGVTPTSYNIDSYSLVWNLSCPVDWKCAQASSGTDACPLPTSLPSDTISADVNGDGCIGVLKGYDDWSNLKYWQPPQLGGGVPFRKESLPKRELDGKLPTLLTTMMVSHVDVKPSPAGVAVRWARIPLQRVIGYEVLRKGLGGRPSIVWRGKENEYVDKSASTGVPYTYSVRPVFAVSALQEAQALVAQVNDAVAAEATLLEARARKLHLLPEGSKLVRGLSTTAATVTMR